MGIGSPVIITAGESMTRREKARRTHLQRVRFIERREQRRLDCTLTIYPPQQGQRRMEFSSNRQNAWSPVRGL